MSELIYIHHIDEFTECDVIDYGDRCEGTILRNNKFVDSFELAYPFEGLRSFQELYEKIEQAMEKINISYGYEQLGSDNIFDW